tara:strand:+ start:689 stop:1885 length:1197 start_codon:yes stop_codon:yes gene_type:complete
MNILEQIRKEHSWLETNRAYDLRRGKPSTLQLDITQSILETIEMPFHMDNVDLRNYGDPEGIPSARALGTEILGTNANETIALDNSSLTLMHQTLACAYFLGFKSSKIDSVSKILCPAPGYDRHFKLIENFGIEMITVPFQDDGPDLNAIEAILKKEKNVNGIVCVPRHSNPTGHTYSDENVRSMFEMFSTLNNNFMILWDNAYACHDLKNTIEQTNASSLAKEFNLENNLFQFGSTSKITFAGSGISFLSSSKNNLEAFIEYRNSLAVCPNKINQGLHVEYFKKMPLKKQMQKMKESLLPKFEITKHYLNILKENNLGNSSDPTGGYFFSYDSNKSNCHEIIDICKELNLQLLPAGSSFPYNKDPDNKNIRIAPSFAENDELEKSMKILTSVVKHLN